MGGGFVGIEHLALALVEQPPVGGLSSKGVENLMRDSSFKTLYRSVPRALRGRIANYSTGGDFGSLSLLSSTTIEGLGTMTNRCVRVSDHPRADFVPPPLQALVDKARG